MDVVITYLKTIQRSLPNMKIAKSANGCSVTHHILKTYCLKTEDLEPTIWRQCCRIAQLWEGYIEGDKMKHTSPEFFYTHEQQKKDVISMKHVQSNDNFTEFL